MSQETVFIYNITGVEDWTEDPSPSPSLGRKGTITNPIVLPALSPDIEAKLMAGTVKPDKVKSPLSDRTIETFAKKMYERFQEKDKTFVVRTILEEEKENPQRIYDVLNIFEGLGLVSKEQEAGSFKCLGQDNMKSTLRKIRIDAEDNNNNFSSLLYTALAQGEVLQFPEQQEERSRNLKEFHLTVLTEKILKIFYSLELLQVQGLTYQEVIALLHKGDEDKDKYHSTVRVRVVRLLNTLVSLGLLSRAKGGMNKDLYRLVDRVDVKVVEAEDVPEEIVIFEVNVNTMEEIGHLMEF